MKIAVFCGVNEQVSETKEGEKVVSNSAQQCNQTQLSCSENDKGVLTVTISRKNCLFADGKGKVCV